MKELLQLIKEQIPDWGLERIRNGDPFTVEETENGFAIIFTDKKKPAPCTYCGDKRGQCFDCE